MFGVVWRMTYQKSIKTLNNGKFLVLSQKTFGRQTQSILEFGMVIDLAIYKVLFSGYAILKADSAEEAEELFYDDDWGIIETEIDNVVKLGD